MTKTTKQVVAEALGIHADHPDMWDLEARDVVNALREAGMLRESRPVIDREKLIDVLVMTDLSDFAGTDMGLINQCADAVIAHLDADTVDDRTEWDYDVVQRPEDCTTISSLAFPTLDKAKNWRQHLRNMGHGDRLIMRRRRAGEWEEIPNE